MSTTARDRLLRLLAAEAVRCSRGLEEIQVLCLKRAGAGRPPVALLEGLAEDCDTVVDAGCCALLFLPNLGRAKARTLARGLLAGEGGLAALVLSLPRAVRTGRRERVPALLEQGLAGARPGEVATLAWQEEDGNGLDGVRVSAEEKSFLMACFAR